MKPLSLVFVIVLLTSISLNCLKKDDKQTTLKQEVKISDSVRLAQSEYRSDSILNAEGGITYYFSKKIDINKIDLNKFFNKNVIIKGTFNYNKSGGFGHFGMFVGEISNITEIKLLKNQNPDKYLSRKKLLANTSEYNGKIVTVACFMVFGFETVYIDSVR